MSFTPLPTSLTTILAELDPGCARVIDLGCGDGRFSTEVARFSVPIIGLDRALPGSGTSADLVGDALRPPLASSSCDLILVGNLVRHLIPAHPQLDFLSRWVDLLRPGGFLFIAEDEPVRQPKGAVRYRQLQAFLAQVMPQGRGPLIGLAEFRQRSLPVQKGAAWNFGGERNEYPLDAEAAAAMLSGADLDPEGEAARLATGIRKDGLDPGRFWWALARRDGDVADIDTVEGRA
jgi:SAM-dependent methyltransferase